MTFANQLTLLRICLVPAIVVLLVYQQFGAALGCFLLAGVTDFLDGMLARRWGQRTRLGEMLDPLADKLLTTSTLLALSIPYQEFPVHIPPWLAILSIGRDFGILLGVLVFNLAVTRRSFPPSRLGKLTTAAHLLTILWVIAGNTLGAALGGTNPLLAATGLLTVASAIHYAYIGHRLFYEAEHETTTARKD